MKTRQKINVLIPDGESHFALWMVNCLSVSKEIRIHVASQQNWVESRFSKHIVSFSTLKKDCSNKLYLASIKNIIQKNKIDILLPSSFPTIRLYSELKKEIKEMGVEIVVSETESLDIANCKWKLAQFLKRKDILIPKTDHCKNLNLSGDYSFPIIVKPLSSWNGSGFVILNNKIDVQDYLLKKPKSAIFQEYIKGDDYCVNILASNGQIRAHTIQKGILPNSNKFKPNLGCLFETNKKLFEIAEKIIFQLAWSGVVNFDVRHDVIKDRFYIIEMNPRFWGSVEASERVGVNFPYLMSLLSAKIDFEVPMYREENYLSNRGIVKIIKDFFMLRNSNVGKIQNSSIQFAIKDPKPKIFKYSFKIVIKSINFLERVKTFVWIGKKPIFKGTSDYSNKYVELRQSTQNR